MIPRGMWRRAECPKCGGAGTHMAVPPQEVTDEWFCGEDTAWCLAAKKAGLKLMVDPMCKVGHLKEQLLEPDFKVEGVNGVVQEAPPPEYERVSV